MISEREKIITEKDANLVLSIFRFWNGRSIAVKRSEPVLEWPENQSWLALNNLSIFPMVGYG